MGSTLLYLVRHGEQQPGDPAGGLSPLGEQQARHLGRRLADVRFDVLRHSPLPRAAQTARILGGYLPGVPVTGCELLRDRTPVPAAGQDDAEFGFPPAYRPFLDSVPVEEADPGGEQLDVAVSQLAVAGRDDRCELLVTHNFVIGWFVRHALDAPWWRWMGLNQFNCALTIVQVLPDTPPMLVSFNDLGHLPVGLRGAPPVPLRS